MLCEVCFLGIYCLTFKVIIVASIHFSWINYLNAALATGATTSTGAYPGACL